MHCGTCIIGSTKQILLLRQGWGLFERTCKFAGNQFTKRFIEFVLVETNLLFGSNSNVFLTLQACGHRSSRVAGLKRQALAFYFSVRIWYMFWILKCKRKLDLGLWMTSAPEKRMQLHSADFRLILPDTFLNRKSALRMKLNPEQAIDIFKTRRTKKVRTAAAGLLATKYGIAPKAVRDIWTRKSWVKDTWPPWNK